MTDTEFLFVAVLVLAAIILLLATAVGKLAKAIGELDRKFKAQRETSEPATDDSAPTSR